MHTDHLIHMPRSRGWNAPEWHHRGFTYRDAEKMDVYSFGLLCLWLFFFDELEYISDLFRVKVPAIVDELLSAETKQAVDLKRVLRLSLESNPASRPTFSFLSKLLESTRYSIHKQSFVPGLWHLVSLSRYLNRTISRRPNLVVDSRYVCPCC